MKNQIEGIRECKIYSIKETAELLGCHYNTIFSAVKSGELKALQTKTQAKNRIIGKFIIEWLQRERKVK